MKERFQGSTGATTLFFIFVLVPVFFFLAGLSLDITLYYTQKRRAQRALDEAAVLALKYLPYQEAATQSVAAFLERYPVISEHVEIDISPDSVNLQLLAPAQLVFPSYFGYSGDIPYAAISRAQSKPVDAMLMYDASGYLAPDLPLGAPWGDQVDWPAADLFSFDLSVLQDEDGDGEPTPIDSRLLTQQCFNGAFSAIKHAVISTHSFLSSFNLNAVGIGSFPGNAPFISIHHPVLPQAVSGEGGQTTLHPFSAQYMKTDYCLAAAKREVNTLKYQMPSASSGLTSLWSPPTGAPLPYNPEDFLFNTDYEPYMPVAEAVWSTTTRQGETGNLQDIFTNIRTTLMTVPPIERRGGLVHKAKKAAVVIFGDMPFQNGERYPAVPVDQALVSGLNQALSDVQTYDKELSIFLVFLRHANSPVNYASEVSSFQARVEDLLDGVEPTSGSLRVKALYAKDVATLTTQLVPLLGRDYNQGVLAR